MALGLSGSHKGNYLRSPFLLQISNFGCKLLTARQRMLRIQFPHILQFSLEIYDFHNERDFSNSFLGTEKPWAFLNVLQE